MESRIYAERKPELVEDEFIRNLVRGETTVIRTPRPDFAWDQSAKLEAMQHRHPLSESESEASAYLTNRNFTMLSEGVQ